MANQYFYKVSDIAAPVGDLTISNNLRVGGTSIAGPIEKTLNIPTATAAPDADNLIKITAEQSGTTFILAQNASFNQIFVLPPAAIGLNYTFIVGISAASTIAIMPYGYTDAIGNPPPTGNGVAEAYADSIQAITKVGNVGANYNPGARSGQVNSEIGVGTSSIPDKQGGILFADDVGATASLRLICVSTSITGTVASGAIRWIGTGQTAAAAKINVTT